MKIEAEEIVKLFDECREYVFGYGEGRDNYYADDLETAKSWIDGGVNYFLAAIVFYEQMTWMHEKYLKFRDRKHMPSSLKVFDENIKTAIRRQKNGGNFESWEQEIAQWAARYRTWQKKRLWDYNNWGPDPSQSGTRVPKSVLKNAA